MNSILLKRAFEKAKKEIDTEIKTRASKYLSDFIFEDTGEQYGERILRDKYNKVKNNETEKIELRNYVQEALSNFLGYDNYLHFINENKKENKDETVEEKIIEGLSFFDKIKTSIKKNKIYLIVGLLSIISISIYQIVTKQKCMVWQEDHYVEVACDLSRIQRGNSVLYKKDRIKSFKQIYPDSNYPFFTPDGAVTVWYGKNKKGDLEFFTDLGLHPETGKTLKPITQYMIDKYL